MLYQLEMQVALEAVREAAQLCMSVRGASSGLESVEKADASPVTTADFGSQALVCRRLRDAFREDGVIAEESASMLRRAEAAGTRERLLEAVRRHQPRATASDVLGWIDVGTDRGVSSRHWTLDPIDGTKGFIRGGQYVVALALIVEGEVVLGALACPNLALPGMGSPGVIVAAQRGEGAWQYDLQTLESNGRLAVGRSQHAAAMRFCESVESGHSAHDVSARIATDVGIRGNAVRMDSQAKYAAVAAGMADIYLRLPVSDTYVENIWDHAAGCVIVEEAGGRVTDMHGRPLDFSRGAALSRNEGIVASHGPIHDRLIESIRTQV